MYLYRHSCYFLFLLALTLTSGAVAAEKEPVDFNRDIRPILSENCFQCHGPDRAARKARLRLDLRESATAKLRRGRIAIVPGKPEESQLIQRIFAKDEAELMPPPEIGKRLSEKEKQLLQKWIAQGAPYARHWAYVTPRRPAVPTPGSWGNNPVDAFILDRLKKENLEPSPEADRYALIRRVTLDLTGLPPTLAEVDAFVNDQSPHAYEKLVDRLLASPAFGERWGRLWLDLARYADSSGYADDPPRTIWMYRNWVIQAYNSNMPFDEFTIQQLAGDLLPNPSHQQLLATAFHRNTMTNNEGGTSDEEFRNAAVVDRVNTTMQIWMGATAQCAQCHDHKYDPLSQKEYFQIFAIFNNTEDSDKRDEQPTLISLTPAQQERKLAIQRRIAELKEAIAKKADQKKEKEPRKGPLEARYVRVEHAGNKAFLSLAEVQVFFGDTNLALKGKASQSSTAFGGPARLAVDGNTNGNYTIAKSTTHTAQENQPWWEVDLGSPKALSRVVIWNRTDGGTGNRLNHFRVVVLDAKRKPLWVKTIQRVPRPRIAIAIPSAAEKLTKADLAELASYQLNGKLGSKESREIAALQKELSGLKGVPTPIFRELPEGKRRKTYIQIRGSFQETGEEVFPAAPESFHPLEAKKVDRLAFAKWLVDPENPLTARVLVNRYWEQLFGIGLVETSEDFGLQGEAPSHAELLDWLATEVIAQKWDRKRLLRLLVTSAAYRQSSRVTPELLEGDRANRLLARGPRFRLSAEMIRDQALAIGGLLSRKMYGPSVRPPRPQLGLRAAFGGSTDWKTSTGEDRYRRGLYTSWRRSDPYPSMASFDAPSREVCTVRRIRTNTPLQALVTLNDPVYIEAAQGMARKVLSQGGDAIAAKVRFAFQSCLSRPPTERELVRLVSLYDRAYQRFAQNKDQAIAMATDPLGPLPKGMDVAEAAAWTVMGNVLMNLDEFLARR